MIWVELEWRKKSGSEFENLNQRFFVTFQGGDSGRASASDSEKGSYKKLKQEGRKVSWDFDMFFFFSQNNAQTNSIFFSKMLDFGKGSI